MALEIEYKFAVEELPPGTEEELSFEPIRQGYLAAGPPNVRVRRKGERGFLTLKGTPSSNREGEAIVRTEFEYEIPARDADELLAMAKTFVLKRRAKLDSGVELDIFEGPHAGLVFAEFECAEGTPPPSPPEGWRWRDVTNDERYSNAALARDGIPAGAPLIARFRERTR